MGERGKEIIKLENRMVKGRGRIENIFMGKHFKEIFIGQHGGREGL